MNRRLLPSLLIAGLLLAVPASASAKTNVAVGIGDQSPAMFTDANWKALNLKKTRYFVEWNTIDQPGELQKADAFVAAARAAGVSVLMHISTDDINSQPRKPLPSNSAYKTKVGALVARYRALGVKDWGVWNEANHKSQPTAKSPKRAAEFYKTFRKFKCSGCKIVALDVLDQAGVERYIASWLKAAGSLGNKARIIGIHNYSEVNRKLGEKRSASSFKRYPGTTRIIKAVRKKNKVAKFWLTETGGLASFGNGFKCDRNRQSSTTKFMFSLIKKHDKNVERLYSYNYFGNGCTPAFDGGLVEANGTPRPAYNTFKSQLKNTQR
ncbi:glycosyl hydrolase [Aromatoleum sp.]|uniref:glycosyl hydrolase n=1 Tax=Aromatoleum sp. TaxID=2307007 RepID=UPI002FC88870